MASLSAVVISRIAQMMSSPTGQAYVRGALFGLAAVSIWSGWIVVARLALRTSLTPWDITAIRFGVAGIIVLPYLIKKGLAVDRLGLTGLAAILLGGGSPMVLVANAGLVFAPAAHAGALFPGVMPLQVTILAAFLLGEAFTVSKRIGFVLILVGAIGIVWGAGGTIGSRQNIGHALFLAAGLLWAFYTVAMRNAQLEGLHAAAIAAAGALVTYVPAYGAVTGMSLFNAPLRDIVLQAFVQGLLTAVISLLLYGQAINILGASSGAAFAALCPAMTALFSIPVLGEWPTTIDWLAIILISIGVYFVSGGPMPVTLTAKSK
jgi:drug/metabolite transporter (DMT)-like permease